jgi:hypothetical protein
VTKLQPRGGFRQGCGKHLRRTGALVGTAIVLAGSGQRAGAQQLTAAGAWTVTSEDEGVGTVRGGELRWQQPVFRDQLLLRLGCTTRAARLELHRARCASTTSRRVTATGSRLERTDQLSTVSLGLGRDARSRANVQLVLFADLLAGRLRARELGRQTRARRTESEPLVGAQAGVDGTWWLSARSPVGLSAGALFGVIKPAGSHGLWRLLAALYVHLFHHATFGGCDGAIHIVPLAPLSLPLFCRLSHFQEHCQ